MKLSLKCDLFINLLFSLKLVNNFKFLSVIGQPHEIHAATDTLPGIVLHVAEGHECNNITVSKTSVKIPPTRVPKK